MKLSLALTAFILSVGLVTGLIYQKKIGVLHENRLRLLSQAVKLGIELDDGTLSRKSETARLHREERNKLTNRVTLELASFARDMEQLKKDGREPNEAFNRNCMEVLQRLVTMNPEQLETVITDLRNEVSLNEDTRCTMISSAIVMLAEDHPDTALHLISASADLLTDSVMGQQAVLSSIKNFAKFDPHAALRWVEENSSAHPNIVGAEARYEVLAGAAETDPKIAFKLITELGFSESPGAVQSIVESAKTPEQRAAILSAFRDHLAGVNDGTEREALREEALSGLARGITGEGFDSVKAWAVQQKLSPEESDSFIAGISYDLTKTDTGRWIDWMAGTLPPDRIGARVGDLVGQWTQQDYLAAGHWLNAAPEGPAKTAAVRSYANTVARHEPQTAAQWAMTLPAGEERDATMKSIYENWPKSDAAAAEVFANEHNIAH